MIGGVRGLWPPLCQAEDALSVIPELALRSDIAIESDALDPEFLAEDGHRRVALRHDSLRKANLSFADSELSTPFSSACSGSGETGHGSLTDQIPFELGKSGEDAEDHPAGCCRGVDLGALASENPEADLALRQVFHRVDEVSKRSSETIEFPNHQHITGAQGSEARRQARSVVAAARGTVLIDVALLDTGGRQGIELQVEGLGAIGFGDAGVSDQHVSQTVVWGGAGAGSEVRAGSVSQPAS